MAMSADKLNRPVKSGRTPQRQPDYPDEICQDTIEAIRKLADPDGTMAKKRTLLYSPAW
jgi:hypothetical protein